MSDPKRILLIDDDADFRASVRALLETAGYAVLEECDGEGGLRTARSAGPHLILLDVMMRERTEGFFVLQEIRRTPSLADLPVIVSSSLYSEHPFFRVREDAGWMPADLFLPKPLRPKQLLEEVARLLARAPAESRP
ncbi:MAG TPA: response regulator [Candidatus Polarisedimenticolaceae bacterium]|nr:response regulator [Candidatus Polarisedimenticolaceae bacterium]